MKRTLSLTITVVIFLTIGLLTTTVVLSIAKKVGIKAADKAIVELKSNLSFLKDLFSKKRK